jgi:hypothetical protein
VTNFEALHVEHTGTLRVPLPLARAFPLFTPEGERAWVPGWEPVYLFPRQPSADAGTVFTTRHGDEETHWVVLRHAPAEGVAEYARFAPATRAGTVRVECTPTGAGETTVRVGYALTALTPAGNAVLAALTPAAFAAMLAEWEELIRRSLRR